ncbi:MAG TPA: lamin tail domain-containing protein [Acidobacteriota bacterium]|nr:lamin tail domain-containing protein [Acidobacteriota bacterium]
MKTGNAIALGSLLLLIASGLTVESSVVVNEAMVNEPGGNVNLEWFELFNDSDGLVNLDFFQAQIGADTLNFAGGGAMLPKTYAVICRDSLAFVQEWVDNPADVPYTIIQRTFGLTNDGGLIRLFRLSNPESELLWTESGADGVSWERILPESGDLAQSTDPRGATPGQVNSVTPLPLDLSLGSVAVEASDDGALLTFIVSNVGLNTVTGSNVTVYYVDPADSENRDSVVVVLPVPPVDTGFTTILQTGVAVPGYYVHLGASVDDDDRPANNHRDFFAPGTAYPPVVLNEFLADPKDPLTSEWVEVYNRSDSTLDISEWMLGDELGLHAMCGPPLVAGPGDYVVLAEDAAAFERFYGPLDGLLCEPLGWAKLNDQQGDVVRLVDPFGIEADRFAYVATFDSNYTWSLSEGGVVESQWGRSSVTGGSPGERNDVFVPPSATGLQVDVYPRIFSPDGDGWQDVTVITIIAPPAADYTMKVYDSDGRVVKTFMDKAGPWEVRVEYTWDGRADSGNRLPIGIYILYFDAGGVESSKKTVVIAR